MVLCTAAIIDCYITLQELTGGDYELTSLYTSLRNYTTVIKFRFNKHSFQHNNLTMYAAFQQLYHLNEQYLT